MATVNNFRWNVDKQKRCVTRSRNNGESAIGQNEQCENTVLFYDILVKFNSGQPNIGNKYTRG